MGRLLIFCCLILTACIAPETGDDAASPTPAIQWPTAPAAARIEYVREFNSPEDLGMRMSTASKFWRKLTGEDKVYMVRPYAIAASNGMVLIADPGLDAVHLFDTERSKYKRIDKAGNDFLTSPVGVALGSNRLFVADSESGKVFILDSDGKLLKSVSGIVRPTGLAFDFTRERLYVADTLSHRVVVLDREGNKLFEFGSRGTGDGELNFPTHISLSAAGLIVNDSMNFRIQTFTRDGQFFRVFGEHGDSSGFLSQPKGVAADIDGNVYVSGATNDRVQIFSHVGEFLLAFGGNGTAPGKFTMPTGLAIDGDLIYVADSYNQRVQVFRYLPNE